MISYTIVGETLVTPAHVVKGWPKSSAPTATDDVLHVVCDVFGVTRRDLKSPRRHRSISWPRMAACHLLRHYTSRSYPEIGRSLGNRDHTTVMYALKRVQKIADADSEFREKLDQCVTRLNKVFGETV